MNRFPRASAPPRHIDWWPGARCGSASSKVLGTVGAEPLHFSSFSIFSFKTNFPLSNSGELGSVVSHLCPRCHWHSSNASSQLVLVLFCSQWLCRGENPSRWEPLLLESLKSPKCPRLCTASACLAAFPYWSGSECTYFPLRFCWGLFKEKDNWLAKTGLLKSSRPAVFA